MCFFYIYFISVANFMSLPTLAIDICYLMLFYLVGFHILCNFIKSFLHVALAESLSLSLSIDPIQSYSFF